MYGRESDEKRKLKKKREHDGKNITKIVVINTTFMLLTRYI